MSVSTSQRTVSDASLTRDIGKYLRYQLRGRRGFILAAVAIAAPALWLGWPWLVAAGLAPLLLAMAPCAVMCGLGLCMRGTCKKTETAPGGAAGAAMQRAADGTESPKSLGSCCAKEDSAPDARTPR